MTFVRHQGLSHGGENDLKIHFQSRPSAERHQQLEVELCRFVQSQSVQAQHGERLVGSTEVIESVFGKWQNLERQESRSGITTLVLSLGAWRGWWTTERIQTALEKTPVKNVAACCASHLPQSLQSLRRLAFADS